MIARLMLLYGTWQAVLISSNDYNFWLIQRLICLSVLRDEKNEECLDESGMWTDDEVYAMAYIQQARRACQSVPVLLCGLKKDLREDAQFGNKIATPQR